MTTILKEPTPAETPLDPDRDRIETPSPRSSLRFASEARPPFASIRLRSTTGSRSRSGSRRSGSRSWSRRSREQVIDDIRFSQARVREFAEAQRGSISDFEVETLPGIRLGQRNIPVGSVGSYVPGGRYPMVASATMSNLTASVAGVERVVSVTPPLDGELPATTIAAMHLAGADEIYVLGGVQAVAALALGTEEIDAVDMIVGPGNAYVAEAKRQLFGEIGIDLLAGPTEILVVADDSADPETVAADLLGQAEHGPNTPAVLISTSRELASAVLAEVDRQLESLPTAGRGRRRVARAWVRSGSSTRSSRRSPEADELAFEHVEIHTREPRFFLDRMRNYGTLFLGENTTVAYGDKTIGTNHILPDRRRRPLHRRPLGRQVPQDRDLSGVHRRRRASPIGEVCARQCRVENFEGHALSCDVRVRRFS